MIHDNEVLVDEVLVGSRHRRLDMNLARALAESIREIGLRHPISIWRDEDGRPNLVAGLHRLEAFKLLGRKEIFCVLLADDRHRELWQIDENLIRAELTELERAQHLQRRKELSDLDVGEDFFPTSLKEGPAAQQHQKGFDQRTAEATGMDKSTIRKSRRRAKKICAEAQSIIKQTADADSGVDLDALANLSHADQVRAAEMVRDGRAKNAREAQNLIAGDGIQPSANLIKMQIAGLQRVWKMASQEAREEFLKWIGAHATEGSVTARLVGPVHARGNEVHADGAEAH